MTIIKSALTYAFKPVVANFSIKTSPNGCYCEFVSKLYDYSCTDFDIEFFSISEIALAGSRKIKLKLLAESGDDRAEKVLKLQENSADFLPLHKLA